MNSHPLKPVRTPAVVLFSSAAVCAVTGSLFGGDLPPGPALLGEGCAEDREGEADGISCESATSC